MPTRSDHDNTTAFNLDVSTRRPVWSSRQEHLRHRMELRRRVVEDQGIVQGNESENDLMTESDDVSTTDSMTSVSINVSWVNNPRVNHSQHSNEMVLEAFLRHPYVSEIQFTESIYPLSDRHSLEWNTSENIRPDYVLHSMSNVLYEGNAIQHQDRISKMINAWATFACIDVVSSTIGVYDTENRSVSILDIIGQDATSKEIYIAFVLFEDSDDTSSWRDKLRQSESKIARLCKFAKYNQRLLQTQFNINTRAYLLCTSSTEIYPPRFEFEFRI
jgi:hypothetical protein